MGTAITRTLSGRTAAQLFDPVRSGLRPPGRATRSPSPAAVADTENPDVLLFMQLLWALVHALDRASKRMSVELGVTGPQRLVLRVVGLFPGMSAGDLAALLHVHPSTLTGVLRRLVAQRLLARSIHPDDQRRAVLTLTAAGRRANEVRSGTVEAAVATALRDSSDAERAAARKMLVRLAEHLTPRSGHPPALSRRQPRSR